MTKTIEVAGWTMNDFIPILIEYCQEILPRLFDNRSNIIVTSLFDEFYNFILKSNKIEEFFDYYSARVFGRHVTQSSTTKFISETYLRLLQNKVQQQLNLATSSNEALTTNTPAVRRYEHS